MTAQTHILLIEDDPALRIMLRGILELQDFIVSEAESRSDGLAKLQKRVFLAS